MKKLNMEEKKEIVDERAALIEMYKAGFLDGTTPKPRSKKDFEELKKRYKKAFFKRFGKKIIKELKKKK